MRSVLLVLFLLLTTSSWAAKAKVERTFYVAATQRQVEDWLVSHRNELAVARGFIVVSRNEKHVRARITSPLAEQEVTLERVAIRDETGTTLGWRLLTVHRGDLVDYRDQLQLVPAAAGTNITMTSYVETPNNAVGFEGVSDFLLETYINRKMDKAEAIIKAVGSRQ